MSDQELLSQLESARNELAAFIELHEQLRSTVESAAESVGIDRGVEPGVGCMVMSAMMAERIKKAEAAIETVTKNVVTKLAVIYEGKAKEYANRFRVFAVKRDKLAAGVYAEMAHQLRTAFGLVVSK